MAEPSKELTKALNDMRDEFMRLHAAFYAGTLGAEEQAELAKHCVEMIKCTSSIGKGTVRPPPEQVYVEVDALDPDEKTYIKSIRSSTQTGTKMWGVNVPISVSKQDMIGKGKIVKEGDKI